MNPKNILVAIKERDRWVERRHRLSNELEKVRTEKVLVTKELIKLKEEIAKLDEAFSILSSKSMIARETDLNIGVIK
jgi:uncharacterized protein (DUF3084 family)